MSVSDNEMCVLDGVCFYFWTVLLFLKSSLLIEHITSRALPSCLTPIRLFRSRLRLMQGIYTDACPGNVVVIGKMLFGIIHA